MTRAEAIEYYKSERDRFEKTRSIQWKFSISMWGLIALGITFFDNSKINAPNIVPIGLCILFLFAHFIFSYYTQKGLIASRTRSDDILSKLNAKTGEFVYPTVIRDTPTKLEDGDKAWIFFQILATDILLLILLTRILN